LQVIRLFGYDLPLYKKMGRLRVFGLP
jgi:hypothetical protein